MADIPPVTINILGNATGLSDEIARVNRALAGIGNNVGATNGLTNSFTGLANGIKSVLGPLAAMAAAYVGIRAIISGVGSSIQGAADMQSTLASFKVMTGSMETAKDLMADLVKFAKDTPFELPEITDSARMLLAYGFSAKEVQKELLRLGDVSSATGQSIKDIAYLYGTARVQGRLFAADVNQFTNRGIPIITELAKVLGVGEEKVKGLVEAGKVGFPEVQQAFANMSGEGGRFHGQMDEQSKTWNGMMANLKDSIGGAMRAFGDPIIQAVGPYLKELIGMTDQFEDGFRAAGQAVAEILVWLLEIGKQAAQIGSIIVQAFQTGNIGKLFGLALQIGAMEGLNILFRGIEALFVMIKQNFIETFKVVANPDFWVGLVYMFAGLGDILLGVVGIFGGRLSVAFLRAFGEFYENFYGGIIFAGDRLTATFKGIGLILKEAFLSAAIALMDAIQPVADMLGFGDSVRSAKDNAESGKILAGRDLRELQGEEATAFNAPPGEQSGWDKAKGKARGVLDGQFQFWEGVEAEGKNLLNRGITNAMDGTSMVAPIAGNAVGNVLGAGQQAFKDARNTFDTGDLQNQLGTLTDEMRESAEKQKTASDEQAKKTATDTAIAKKTGEKEDAAIGDSLTTIGGGGGVGGDDSILSENEKQTRLQEEIARNTGLQSPTVQAGALGPTPLLTGAGFSSISQTPGLQTASLGATPILGGGSATPSANVGVTPMVGPVNADGSASGNTSILSQILGSVRDILSALKAQGGSGGGLVVEQI